MNLVESASKENHFSIFRSPHRQKYLQGSRYWEGVLIAGIAGRSSTPFLITLSNSLSAF